MKSLLTSVAFPAYVLGHDPGKRLIVVSYGADLAIKLSNDFRMIIEAPWYEPDPAPANRGCQKYGVQSCDHPQWVSAGHIDRWLTDWKRR